LGSGSQQCLVHLHTTLCGAAEPAACIVSCSTVRLSIVADSSTQRRASMFVGSGMRASSHDVDARFLIISLTKPPDVHFAKFLFRTAWQWRFLDCHVVIRDRLETLALITVPDTDLTHMAALCMSELAVLYYPLLLTMPESSETCGGCGCSMSGACVMTTIQGRSLLLWRSTRSAKDGDEV
jgi:hypothetical protein